MKHKQFKLPENTCFENGLKVATYKDLQGRNMLRATCETYKHNKKQFYLPASTAIYWYPLYFFYDWYYDSNRNRVRLRLLSTAPKPTKDYLENHPSFNFEDCVDKHSPYDTHDNKIFQDNLAAMMDFKQMGLTTFAEPFAKEDVVRNYAMLENIIEVVHSTCEERFRNDDDSDLILNREELSSNQEEADIKVYSYATDEEKRLLIRVGIAEKMTMLMNKIVLAKQV